MRWVLPEKPPQVDVSPGGSSERAVEAIQIAELMGLTLDDWQQYVLRRTLGVKDGKWAAFECGLVLGRQGGKSETLLARIGVDLFTRLREPRLTIFAAHEYKTAREIFLRLRGLLDPPADAHPLMYADSSLLDQVKTIRTANGEESIELHNGRRVRFLARTSGSGRGFTGDTVLLDEAYRLNREQMAALLPTMGARPDPQVWYASSGPFEDSEVLLSVMDRARKNPGRMAYLGWEAPEGTDPSDRDWWVKCTPSHPHRTSLEVLEDEYAALGPEAFSREKLCMRVQVQGAAIPSGMWEAAQHSDAAPTGSLSLGVDLNPERTAACIAVAGDGALEVVDYGLPSKLHDLPLVDRVTNLANDHGAPVAIDASGPAASLIPILEANGVTVHKYSSTLLAAACGRFYDQLTELRIRPHPALSEAAKQAVKRAVGDAWAWGRKQTLVDISPLVAVTLAADLMLQPKVEDPGLMVYTLE